MELLIPSTYAADERDMKQRAVKYGILARAAAIYAINTITIYEDHDESINTERSADLIEKYLKYAETPPYLRKDLIPYDEDLTYANILPALQIASHGYHDTFREGIVVETNNGECTVNAGLEHPITLYGDHNEGERVTIKLTTENEAVIIDKDDIPVYWGYNVNRAGVQLGNAIKTDKTVVATSRHGTDYRETPVDGVFETTQVLFGSAWRGIPDMIERGDLKKNQLDYMIDFVPTQQTETVRTEEAVLICLSRFLE